MSDSLRPHRLQHTRLPRPSLSPRVCSNSRPVSWWCYPTISSSVTPFSCPQPFPPSWFFPVGQLFTSGGQSIGALASASVLLMNSQSLFPSGFDWFDLLAVWGTLQSLLQHHSLKASIFWQLSLLYDPTLTSVHDYWKNYSFDYMDICWQSDISAF